MRWAKQSRWLPTALVLLDKFPDANFTSTEAILVVPDFRKYAGIMRTQGILTRKHRGYSKDPSIYFISPEAKEWLKTQR